MYVVDWIWFFVVLNITIHNELVQDLYSKDPIQNLMKFIGCNVWWLNYIMFHSNVLRTKIMLNVSLTIIFSLFIVIIHVIMGLTFIKYVGLAGDEIASRGMINSFWRFEQLFVVTAISRKFLREMIHRPPLFVCPIFIPPKYFYSPKSRLHRHSLRTINGRKRWF